MATNLERYDMNDNCRQQPKEQNTCMVLSGNDLSGEVPDDKAS